MLPAFLASAFVAAALAAVLPSSRTRSTWLVAYAVGHLVAVASFWVARPTPVGLLVLDDPGLLFLTITAVLFSVIAYYTPFYLAREGGRTNRVFVACLLAFVGAMDLVCSTRHFGLLWVAVEATTLASAPLIAHPVTPRGLEATWKYLMLCSVGIGVALLGTFFLGLSALDLPTAAPFTTTGFTAVAPHLSAPWLKGAFALLLVGYGTKMGLVPMHSWLPDAHSEAPSPVSALLSGALLNCAFLGLLRVLPVLDAAGQGPFGRGLLVVLGLASLTVAAAFILGQQDLKRMLAYSSVEHMGVLALGVGLGGLGTYGALLHAVNHSLTKALLFLAAGNILALYGTKNVAKLEGVARKTPWTGALFAGGILAIGGAPPFGVFQSEFTILRAALASTHPWIGVWYLVLLGAVFVGLAQVTLAVVHGPAAPTEHRREPWGLVAPPTVLLAGALALGLVIPAPLEHLLRAAAHSLGG